MTIETVPFIIILFGMCMVGTVCGIIIGWTARKASVETVRTVLKSIGILLAALALVVMGIIIGFQGNWGIEHLALAIPAYLVAVILILVWANSDQETKE